MSMHRASRAVAALAGLALLAPLAACEGQVPTVSAPTADVRTPDLTVAPEKRIRGQILDAIDKANAATSADGLDGRMTGPQLQIHQSRLAVAHATGTLDPRAAIPRDVAQVIIPTEDGWPRTVYTVTTTTKDQQSKRLLVLTQESARSNYKLWGVARLFQGAQLPSFEVPRLGSTMGDPQDKGLVATPVKAVDEYAALLNGDDAHAGDFADDLFRQDLENTAAGVQKGMEANQGTQKQTFTPVDGQIRTMRSTDGGDLVVAQINSEWVRQAGEGRESLPANDDERALFGNAQATSTMKVTYVNVIALYVPPKGDDAKIVAVGADRYPIKVEAV